MVTTQIKTKNEKIQTLKEELEKERLDIVDRLNFANSRLDESGQYWLGGRLVQIESVLRDLEELLK